MEFDLDFHLRAVTEIARVCRGEIRLVPVEYYAPPSRAHDYRDAVCARLKDLGFRCTLRPNELGAVMSCYTHVLVAERACKVVVARVRNRPASMSRQDSQTPQGRAVIVPWPSAPVQFRLLARMRETVVLPTPRVPVKR